MGRVTSSDLVGQMDLVIPRARDGEISPSCILFYRMEKGEDN